jgi:hypothetical protein
LVTVTGPLLFYGEIPVDARRMCIQILLNSAFSRLNRGHRKFPSGFGKTPSTLFTVPSSCL